MKTEFQTYAKCLLEAGTDSQNAFEAAVDEFDLDWADAKNIAEAEEWFNEVEMA